MDTAYWNLFWTTGMPEAWLMSRDQLETPEAAAGPGAERVGGGSGPLAVVQPNRLGNVPGGPEWLY